MTYQRDFKERLKVGVVGIGSHSYRNVLPAMTHLPVELVALCDVNAELLARTAPQFGVTRTYTSAAAMYAAEKLDAVFICVSPRLHPQLAIEAFDAGVHVWLEKPPAMRASEIEAMIARRGDRAAVVGFKKVFMPATRKAREIIGSPEFGTLRSMLAVYPMNMPENGPAVLAANEYTDWLGNGVHPLSMMLGIGGPVSAVTANRGPHGGGAVILEFASGCIGTFHMASGNGRGQPIERYQFFGNSSHVEIDNNARVVWQRGIPFDYGITSDFAPAGTDHGALVWETQNTLGTLENKSLFVQGMAGEMMHFCESVLAGRPAERGTLEFALDVMRVYEAGLMSEGKRIAIQKQ